MKNDIFGVLKSLIRVSKINNSYYTHEKKMGGNSCCMIRYMKNQSGFTILELIVVVAVIALLSSMLIFAVDQTQAKSRDSKRAVQLQEFVKAFELYYTEFGRYPDDGVADAGQAAIFNNTSSMAVDLSSAGYLSRVPADSRHDDTKGHVYCASNDGASMAVAINTERDEGGTDYCVVSLGPLAYNNGLCRIPNPAGSASTIYLSAVDRCSERF